MQKNATQKQNGERFVLQMRGLILENNAKKCNLNCRDLHCVNDSHIFRGVQREKYPGKQT